MTGGVPQHTARGDAGGGGGELVLVAAAGKARLESGDSLFGWASASGAVEGWLRPTACSGGTSLRGEVSGHGGTAKFNALRLDVDETSILGSRIVTF